MKEIIVIAVGGNSLVDEGSRHISYEEQLKRVRLTAVRIASIMEREYTVAITHGNGPQVGHILLQSSYAKKVDPFIPEIPLDIANAYTQASIGYILAQTIENELKKRRNRKKITTVVTRVVVDKNDPAFDNPTKFIGPWYPKEEAKILEKEYGWIMKEDSGRGYRRVVPSPEPKKIVEIETIRTLIQKRVSVVCVGGGGIPVIEEDGEYRGVSAVIDKDLASSLLAEGIKAVIFLISTQVDAVYLDYGKPYARKIEKMTVKEAEKYLKEGHFPPGSMGPKIEAGIKFLSSGGKRVIITNPFYMVEALEGKKGTEIVP